MNSDELDKKELWRLFGRGTQAGRMLFSLYNTDKPESKVNYPQLPKKVASEYAPVVHSKPKKPCPQRAFVEVPTPVSRKPLKIDKTTLIPKRKHLDQIMLETNGFKTNFVAGPRGVDRENEKDRLALVNSFQRTTCLPKDVQMPGICVSNSVSKTKSSSFTDLERIDIEWKNKFAKEIADLQTRLEIRDELKNEISELRDTIKLMQQLPSNLEAVRSIAASHTKSGPQGANARQMLNDHLRDELGLVRKLEDKEQDLKKIESMGFDLPGKDWLYERRKSIDLKASQNDNARNEYHTMSKMLARRSSRSSSLASAGVGVLSK